MPTLYEISKLMYTEEAMGHNVTVLCS